MGAEEQIGYNTALQKGWKKMPVFKESLSHTELILPLVCLGLFIFSYILTVVPPTARPSAAAWTTSSSVVQSLWR